MHFTKGSRVHDARSSCLTYRAPMQRTSLPLKICQTAAGMEVRHCFSDFSCMPELPFSIHRACTAHYQLLACHAGAAQRAWSCEVPILHDMYAPLCLEKLHTHLLSDTQELFGFLQSYLICERHLEGASAEAAGPYLRSV